MREIETFLVESPLVNGEKILALTYMQGARRRIESSLSVLPRLDGRYSCETLDSFARHVVMRWSALREHLGFNPPGDEDFQEACGIAAVLLEREEVISWVSRVYRLIVIDEAQDMDSVRLQLVQALSAQIDTLVAADEFQCLDENLAVNPACTWIREVGGDTELLVQKRTEDAEILAAAAALRAGQPVPAGEKTFKIFVTGKATRTAEMVSNSIGWYGRRPRSTAIISPWIGKYTDQVIEIVREQSSKRNMGPYRVLLETSEKKMREDLIAQMKLAEAVDDEQIKEAAKGIGIPAFDLAITEWLDKQRRARGKRSFLRDEVASEIRSILARQRRGRKDKPGGIRAMTVHGAKNREFDLVIILWPPGVAGSADHQRRLLYNAVTRAKQRCLVFLQTGHALKTAPFV